MDVPALLVALGLVSLTGPDNQTILLNPSEVVTLRTPRGAVSEHFHKDAKCLVFTSDGKFIAVMQTCFEVRERIEEIENGGGK